MRVGWSTSRKKAAATISGSSYAPRSCASCDGIPSFVCAFRHGLLQDAALSSLTPGRRRELYAASATCLRGAPRGLARRATSSGSLTTTRRAGNITQAIAYLERARGRSG